MTEFKLAVIGGDGIGPDVVAEGLKVMNAIAKKYNVSFVTTNYDLGAAHWNRTGEVLTDATLAEIATCDAILLGAVGDPAVPNGILERGLLLKLRFAFDQYVNLRPAKLMEGVKSPLKTEEPIDFVVIREGTEGPYVGSGGFLAQGTPREIAIEENINSRFGVERVTRYSFELAMKRTKKKVTMVHKNNVQPYAGKLWTTIFNEIAAEYPSITAEYLHADAAAMFMVTNPERFDVVVTDNLFGDLLTDIAAAICGGIGLASSGNINPEKKFPSMFEPVHGSAPDIAGKGIADPTATIMSVALMLDHLGLYDAAADVEAAVAKDLATRGDKRRSTVEIGDALLSQL
jgi:3-isopropylmalate dehydrogenase